MLARCPVRSSFCMVDVRIHCCLTGRCQRIIPLNGTRNDAIAKLHFFSIGINDGGKMSSKMIPGL